MFLRKILKERGHDFQIEGATIKVLPQDYYEGGRDHFSHIFPNGERHS